MIAVAVFVALLVPVGLVFAHVFYFVAEAIKFLFLPSRIRRNL